MSLSDYIPIFIQIILAFTIACSILIASHVLGQRAVKTTIKDSPYECGMLVNNKSHPPFSIKFYVTAMLFILFDIEVVFLMPWVLIHREFVANNISIIAPIFFFIGILILGLIYEFKHQAFFWEK